MKKSLLGLAFAAILAPVANAADYVIDDKGAHASINFKTGHLGYSMLTGRFNTFSGTFSYDDANVEGANISVTIDTQSVDSNHADRDKHLRSGDFLNVDKFPQAMFKSTKVMNKGNGKMDIHGDFTLHGVTKPIVIAAEKIGEGQDPWGGYRAGFSGTTRIAMKDYGIAYDLGPASAYIDIELHVEGIKQ